MRLGSELERALYDADCHVTAYSYSSADVSDRVAFATQAFERS